MASPGPLILITRPAELAQATAARLQERGYQTLIDPMLRIDFRDLPPPDLKNFDALAFTSGNGVRAFAAIARGRDLPVFAVGATTAAALRDAGFVDLRGQAQDAISLGHLIGGSMPPKSRILHPCGAAVAGDLGALLKSHAIMVERLTLYDALPADRLSDSLVTALYACTISGVLFYSARTAGQFVSLAKARGLEQGCRSCHAYCLSANVAEAAAGLDWRSIEIANAPNEDSLLELLPILA